MKGKIYRYSTPLFSLDSLRYREVNCRRQQVRSDVKKFNVSEGFRGGEEAGDSMAAKGWRAADGERRSELHAETPRAPFIVSERKRAEGGEKRRSIFLITPPGSTVHREGKVSSSPLPSVLLRHLLCPSSLPRVSIPLRPSERAFSLLCIVPRRNGSFFSLLRLPFRHPRDTSSVSSLLTHPPSPRRSCARRLLQGCCFNDK